MQAAPSNSSQLFDEHDQAIELGDELGRGGEATVYKLKSGKALKLYHDLDPVRAKKLRVMLKNPPVDPTRESGHISIAWPEALVFNPNGNVVGFIMPMLDTQQSIALHQIYNPKIRRQRAPALTWLYLVRIARNLCTVVTALHDKGYVIGDLNESNLIVSDRALVSLVDCDSVQVKDGRKVYRCPVGKAEYTAPELQDKQFKKVNRNKNHDYFALSILIFLLLMEGVHPFAGRYTGKGDPPSLVENIKEGRSPYLAKQLDDKSLKPSLIAPPYKQLPKNIRKLFKRALTKQRFVDRPSSQDWQAVLAKLENNLETCDINPQHVFDNQLKICPWCERADTLGIEAYPRLANTPIVNVPSTKKKAKAKQKRPTKLEDNPWELIKRYPFSSLTLVSLNGLFAIVILQVLPIFMQRQININLTALSSFLILTATSYFMTYQRIKNKNSFELKIEKLERDLRALFVCLCIGISCFLLLPYAFESTISFRVAVSSIPAAACYLVWFYRLRR